MNTDPRGIPELLKSVGNDLTTLLRQEVRLASTETREKLGEMTGAIGLLAGAAMPSFSWWGSVGSGHRISRRTVPCIRFAATPLSPRSRSDERLQRKQRI